MSITYRAAYIPGSADSTSGGIALTTPEDASLSDAELMEAAMLFMRSEPDLFEGYDASDIEIGEWRE